jgi:hypothetical protein
VGLGKFPNARSSKWPASYVADLSDLFSARFDLRHRAFSGAGVTVW